MQSGIKLLEDARAQLGDELGLVYDVPAPPGSEFTKAVEKAATDLERINDYISCHVSQVGGFTPASKIAIMAEQFGVRTARHGPDDVYGHAAQLTLDLVSPNFGIQEYSPFNAAMPEMFHGCPTLKDGYLYIDEAPGWGHQCRRAGRGEVPLYATCERPERWLEGGPQTGWHSDKAVTRTGQRLRPAKGAVH